MPDQRDEITGRIIAVYAGAGGWREPDRDLLFSEDAARMLRAENVTMVRVLTRPGRWRRVVREVTLWRYLDGDRLTDEESVATTHPIEPADLPPED